MTMKAAGKRKRAAFAALSLRLTAVSALLGRGGLRGPLLGDQPVGGAEHAVETVVRRHADAILAVDDEGRGAIDAAALRELLGAIELGGDAEAVHGGEELVLVHAPLR